MQIFGHAVMVFCYQNCSDLLWEKIVLVIEKNFRSSRLKAENKIFEITWTIYSNSERSEQFLVTECFFNLFLIYFMVKIVAKNFDKIKKPSFLLGFFSWKCSTYYKVVRFTCNFFEIWIFRQICWFNLLREICFYISHFEIESLW